MEKYIKIVIDGKEERLPKHSDFDDKHIAFHEKGTLSGMRYEQGYSSTWDEWFLKEVDWYLQPVSESPVPDITQETIKDYFNNHAHEFVNNGYSVTIVWI
jgi:hypothetical protein